MATQINFICRVLLVVVLLGGTSASAQSVPPKWLSAGLSDLTYSYVEVVSADASTVSDARDKAARAIVQRRNLAVGAEMNVRMVDGKITSTGGQKMIVTARILDEYAEEVGYNNWRVYLLVQTLKHPQYSFEPVTVTDQYPFSARAFVPGMEQLHKGQNLKGVLFIAGEVDCVGGIVASEGMRISNVNLINSTHNAQQRARYTDNANLWQNVRNGFIAATAAVYVWNVIDALTSRGARYAKQGSAQFALAPYAAGESVGFAMNINF